MARFLLLLSVGLAGIGPVAQAQLISPGQLSRVHQDLEGIRNCTSCHTLGSRGIDNTLCLTCHEPLRARLEAGRGLHAGLADQNCADCHKEHFGPAFTLIRFDTTRFDHTDSGFRLTGAHQQTSCESCHRPSFIFASDVRAFKGQHGALEKTFLGLDTRCLSCHVEESPHGSQFADKECATCHVTDQWEEATRFDHDQARFKLIGRHLQVDCQGCHPREVTSGNEQRTRYEGIAFADCSSCHEDTHRGAFGTRCQSCHAAEGWHQVRKVVQDRFDHGATGFDLLGEHARLACASCHARPARNDAAINLAFIPGTEQHTYPRVDATNCLSCHVDFHQDVFADTPGGPVCENCHSQDAWLPVSYDLERHNQEARFALAGAHVAAPCTTCHHDVEAGTLTFRLTDLVCQSCHGSENPHGTQFADQTGGTDCAICHTTAEWGLAESFNHDQTVFPLTGQHAVASCASCHTPQHEEGDALRPLYRGLSVSCLGCHEEDDPHSGQFDNQTCDGCHDTETFTIADFDHAQTRFPLDGAHRETMCGQCHTQETTAAGNLVVRYRPLSLACKDCHGGG